MDEPRTATINDTLGTCHSVCESIEERLRSVEATPKEEVPPGAPTAEAAEPGNLVSWLEVDLAAAFSLASRLRHIESHIAAIQERLKALV